jgi:hypothetical protein
LCSLSLPLVVLKTCPTVIASPSASVLSNEIGFSTYFGGTSNDTIHCVVVDDNGSMYIAGATNSNDIPSSGGPRRPYAGSGDFYVTKLNEAGIVYTTYIGGTSFEGSPDIHPGGGCWIDVDDLGRVYMTGYTYSADFPVVNAWDSILSIYADCFALRLSSMGDIEYSTYLGGSHNDLGTSISVDDFGNAYITGWTGSPDFPVMNAFDDSLSGSYDAFITKLDSSGQLSYSTYLGGGLSEHVLGGTSVVDGSGNLYIVGSTSSSDFPTINAYDDTKNGIAGDLFFSKFNSSGHIQSSSFFGGSASDAPGSIAVDQEGNIYISGHGSGDFPKTITLTSNARIFVAKFDNSGQNLIYSTAFGGQSADNPYGLVVDGAGCPFITGSTYSADFPMVDAYDDTRGGWSDSFLVKLSSGGDHILYSSYFGGSREEIGLSVATHDGSVYLAGLTNSTDFGTANPIDSLASGIEGFLVRMDNEWPDIPPITTTETPPYTTTTSNTTRTTYTIGWIVSDLDAILLIGIVVEFAIIIVFVEQRHRRFE